MKYLPAAGTMELKRKAVDILLVMQTMRHENLNPFIGIKTVRGCLPAKRKYARTQILHLGRLSCGGAPGIGVRSVWPRLAGRCPHGGRYPPGLDVPAVVADGPGARRPLPARVAPAGARPPLVPQLRRRLSLGSAPLRLWSAGLRARPGAAVAATHRQRFSFTTNLI